MIKSIPLCSQCISHEITSWLTEKAGVLSPETVKRIYLELRDMKLQEGECIVCNKNTICSDCFKQVLKVLEKSKQKEIKLEFIKMFGFS